MGLDMYLKAKTFTSGYSWAEESEREVYNTIVDTVGARWLADKDSPTAEVSITAGYWRKANAIHGWFVKHVQNGEDECKEHYVSREDLIALQQACQEVLANPSKALDILPPTQGFFFGGYDLDEYYWHYIKETEALIGALLKKADDKWEFFYRSSW